MAFHGRSRIYFEDKTRRFGNGSSKKAPAFIREILEKEGEEYGRKNFKRVNSLRAYISPDFIQRAGELARSHMREKAEASRQKSPLEAEGWRSLSDIALAVARDIEGDPIRIESRISSAFLPNIITENGQDYEKENVKRQGRWGRFVSPELAAEIERRAREVYDSK